MDDPAGVSEEQLDAAEAALGVEVPVRIRRLFRLGDGRYRVDGEWFVVWPLNRIIADNLAAWQGRALPRDLLAIGDDGTGDPFCIHISGEDKVVRWSWIDGAVVGSEGRLADFVAEWTGE